MLEYKEIIEKVHKKITKTTKENFVFLLRLLCIKSTIF